MAASHRHLDNLTALSLPPDRRRPAAPLTYEQVPLRVQVGLIGQAALHDVEAVVVAGPHGGESAAVRAVEHLHQGTDAPRGGADLQIYQKEKKKKI